LTQTGGGGFYYVMPYVEGESLRRRMERDGALPLAIAVQIAREVGDALAYAHSRGIVHRDIKPENILLSAYLGSGGGMAGVHALVSDFGIAQALELAGGERLSLSGVTLGTPGYMSPEQGSGSGPVDARTDVYSLGCVLYEMLAGWPPFSGATAQALIARHALDPVPPLRTVRPEVSEPLEAIVLRALAKRSDDRFDDGRAFAEALNRLPLDGTKRS
jgi:serine/threonine protein kinase